RKQGVGEARDGPPDLLRDLATLNLAAVLFGTIGGFGSLFALLVTPQIPAPSPISGGLPARSLFACALPGVRRGPRTPHPAPGGGGWRGGWWGVWWWWACWTGGRRLRCADMRTPRRRMRETPPSSAACKRRRRRAG